MIGLWLRTADALQAALAVSEKAHAHECEMCRWENGFGARKPLTHTCEKNLSTDDFPHGHPEMDPTDDEREALRIAELDARQADTYKRAAAVVAALRATGEVRS